MWKSSPGARQNACRAPPRRGDYERMSEPSSPKWRPRIAVICIILAAAAWAAKTIRLETELLALLPQDLSSVRGLDGFSPQFASDREVILVADETMPPAEREEALRKLRPVLASIPGAESVSAPGEEMLSQAPTLAAWMVWNLPPKQFQKVIAAFQPEPVRKKLAELPDILAGALDAEELAMHQFDPLGLLKSLSSEQSDGASQWKEQPAVSLTITAAKPLIEFQDYVDFCSAVQRAVDATLPGEKRLLLTGRPEFTSEISQQMRRDMMLMIGVAMALVSAAFCKSAARNLDRRPRALDASDGSSFRRVDYALSDRRCDDRAGGFASRSRSAHDGAGVWSHGVLRLAISPSGFGRRGFRARLSDAASCGRDCDFGFCGNLGEFRGARWHRAGAGAWDY